MANEPHLEHKTYRVKQLIEEYRAGQIVVPEFQRDCVWRSSKAPRLIDSLYRSFPISSLILYRSQDVLRSRNREARPAPSGSAEWLIDGQQRVTTLLRTIDGAIDVVFHPEHDEFRLANVATHKDPSWVHVSELWDDRQYRELRRNLDGSRQSDINEGKFEAVRRILDYEVPVVRMIDHTFQDAVEAFRRLNTLGVRLNKRDIESAQVSAKHSGFVADELIPFVRRIHAEGFRRLNAMHLFRVCGFVATPDGRNRTLLHELDRRKVLAAWRRTESATSRAIGLVRSELGLINMNILWSGALMVPLIALCAKMPTRELDTKSLMGWLALAALCHRYSGSAETALNSDVRACRSADPIGALLANLRKERNSLSAGPEDFAGALADRSGLLALYIACKHRGLLNFFTDGRIVLQDNVDRHHILPRRQFTERERTSADNIANLAFITGDVNRSIGHSGPEVYLAKINRDALVSQCIPLDPKLWRIDQAQRFWRARREELAEAFNEFVREAFPQRHLGSNA